MCAVSLVFYAFAVYIICASRADMYDDDDDDGGVGKWEWKGIKTHRE